MATNLGHRLTLDNITQRFDDFVAADLLRIHMLHLPLMCCPQSLWQRIEVLIGRADTIVFAISPDAAASEISLKKIAEAASLNKRFAPVVWRWDQKHAKQSAYQR